MKTEVSINIYMYIFIMTIATLDSKFGSHFSTNLVKIFIEHISSSFFVMDFGIIMIQHKSGIPLELSLFKTSLIVFQVSFELFLHLLNLSL